MELSRPLRLFIAAIALVVAIPVALLIATSGHVTAPPVRMGLTVAAAGAYVGLGLFASQRRSSNVTGLILTAIGFSVLARGLQAADTPAFFVIGVLSNHVMPVLLGHLLMVYPSGRFDSKLHRNIVAIGYFNALVLAWPPVLVLDTQSQCADCVGNPLLVDANDLLFQAFTVGRLTVDGLLIAGLVIALTRRWYSSVPTQRSILSPVLWSAGATMALFFVVFVSDVARVPVEALRSAELAVLTVSMTVPGAIAYGFVRARFTRADAVGDLVATLTDRRHVSADLRDLLARALEDPTLELAYWIPDRGYFVTADGQAIGLAAPRAGRCWHPVELNGEMIAAIVYDESLRGQSGLIQAVGGAAALSLENKRLEAELRANVQELRHSRKRLIEATDAERRRIERDLHDGAQQHLLSIAMSLRLGVMKLRQSPDEAATMFDGAVENLTKVTEELRDLARGIHPTALADRGLAGALEGLANRSSVRVDVDATMVRLAPQIESVAYFVAAEALTNVVRYAQANKATVSVAIQDGRVTLEVCDDGIGGVDRSNGTGLDGLADRVAAVDGRLEIDSPIGEGTVVRAILPCELENSNELGYLGSDHVPGGVESSSDWFGLVNGSESRDDG